MAAVRLGRKLRAGGATLSDFTKLSDKLSISIRADTHEGRGQGRPASSIVQYLDGNGHADRVKTPQSRSAKALAYMTELGQGLVAFVDHAANPGGQ